MTHEFLDRLAFIGFITRMKRLSISKPDSIPIWSDPKVSEGWHEIVRAILIEMRENPTREMLYAMEAEAGSVRSQWQAAIDKILGKSEEA